MISRADRACSDRFGCSIGRVESRSRPSRRSPRAASCAPTGSPRRLLDVGERPGEDDREFVDESRLERREPVLRMPISGCMIDWWRRLPAPA
jgi:hypothetical protein